MNRERWASFVLLLALFVLGHMVPHKAWEHWNEYNNFASAWLTSKGWVPYRDFFTHHPPFAYWFAAPMVWVLGASASTFHWTLMVFYALVLAGLSAANRRSARPFSFGLFVLFVTLGHVLYFGHLYIADVILAFSALLVFNHFLRFDENHPMRGSDWVAVSLAVFAAIGSTLVAAYPLLILSAGLAVKHFRFERRGQRWPRAFAIAGIVAAPLAVAVACLWATGALRGFYEQVYLFSVVYYRSDTGYSAWAPSASPLGFFVVNAARAIGYLAEAILFRHGAIPCALAWAHVGVVIALAGARRWGLAAAYVAYLFTLMLRIDRTHDAPFVVHSLWAAAWVLQPVGARAAEAWRALRKGEAAPAASYPDVLRVAAAALLVVLLARNYMDGITTRRPPESAEDRVARLCAKLTSPGERIAVLPTRPDIHMKADREPALPCFSYFPVQDRWARLRRRMIDAIETQQAKLIVIDWLFPPGFLNMRTFAEEVREAVGRNYRPLEIGVPMVYARNASFHELLGRYARVRDRPVLEVRAGNLLPLAVFDRHAVTQYFTVDDRVTSAKLAIKVSASRRSDTTADLAFGVVDAKGSETILLRETVKTAEVRYYPGDYRTHWANLRLAEKTDLDAGQRYFFRFSSDLMSPPEALQVWSAPYEGPPGIGETFYGAQRVPRSVCFYLAGVIAPRSRGIYPVIEQSLAREAVAAGDVRQSLTLPEATTVSAVSLLLGGVPGPTDDTSYTLEIIGANRLLTLQTFPPPRDEREWKTFAFEPAFLGNGSRMTVAVRPAGRATTPTLRLWTAGCDVHAGGELSVAGQPRVNDLCFKVYETAPRRAGLPDIAVTALGFEPAAPQSVAANEPLRLTVRVENQGTSPTGPFWLEFLALPKDLSGPQSFAVDSLRIENLEPGGEWRQSLERKIYPLPAGLYTLTAVADRAAEVFESDEENNRVAAEPADLLILGPRAR